jgi:hypothetical protein
MSATAILLRDSSVAVTGSDEAIYPPISQVLAREEFACQAPYAAQNIPDDDDLIVIGKNARLVPSENNEVSMSVPAPFVWRCLSGSAVAPFPHPLIEPDMQISRIRLSDKTHLHNLYGLRAHACASALMPTPPTAPIGHARVRMRNPPPSSANRIQLEAVFLSIEGDFLGLSGPLPAISIAAKVVAGVGASGRVRTRLEKGSACSGNSHAGSHGLGARTHQSV